MLLRVLIDQIAQILCNDLFRLSCSGRNEGEIEDAIAVQGQGNGFFWRVCRFLIDCRMIDTLREYDRFLCLLSLVIIDFQAQHERVMFIRAEGIHPGGKSPGDLLFPSVFVDPFAEGGATDRTIMVNVSIIASVEFSAQGTQFLISFREIALSLHEDQSTITDPNQG